MLASWQEGWEDVEVFTAALVLWLVQVMGVDQEWLPVLKVLLKQSLPIAQDCLESQLLYLVKVVLLIFGQVLVGTHIVAGWGNVVT